MGPAADQYACGVVLYELLTGRVPFEGPPAAVIHQVISTEPEPAAKRRAGLPRDLDTICRKAMSKRPGDRYPTCRGLADDLRRWLDGEPVTARPLSAAEKLGRWAKANRAVAGLTAAVAACLVLATVVTAGAAVRLNALADDAAREATAARKAEADAEAARREADAKATAAVAAEAKAVAASKEADEQRRAAELRADEAKKAKEVAVAKRIKTEAAISQASTAEAPNRLP